MLISFTQTYGNDRSKLHEIYSRDKRLIQFKNMFDINIHSFHNCNKETIDNYKNLNKVKNSIYLEFNNIPYSQTIKHLKYFLKEKGCTYFFFSQDDTFSDENSYIDWVELLDYVKEHNKNFMLDLHHVTDMLDIRIKLNEIKNTFNVYHLTSLDFHEKIQFAMDDSPYICSIDMLDVIYDDKYVQQGSVWNSERYLFEKFKTVKINRYLLSDLKKTFKNYNIFGRTTHHRDFWIKQLKQKGLYDD